MSRDGPSRNFVANGLHYNRKGRAKFVFLERARLDCGLHCARVGMRDCFRLEWCRIAFFGSYIFHVLMIYLIVRRLSGFEWSSENIRVGLLFILFVGLVFGGFLQLPDALAMAVGIFALIASSVYSTRSLLKKISLNHIPRPVLRLLGWFRFIQVTL